MVGEPLAEKLKAHFGEDRVAAQGVTYYAELMTNMDPDGADPRGIADMVRLFNNAAETCPNSVVVAGGYSQGAAMTHEAIKELSDDAKARILGIVLFGDGKHICGPLRLRSSTEPNVQL
jgi:cutinase